MPDFIDGCCDCAARSAARNHTTSAMTPRNSRPPRQMPPSCSTGGILTAAAQLSFHGEGQKRSVCAGSLSQSWPASPFQVKKWKSTTLRWDVLYPVIVLQETQVCYLEAELTAELWRSFSSGGADGFHVTCWCSAGQLLPSRRWNCGRAAWRAVSRFCAVKR